MRPQLFDWLQKKNFRGRLIVHLSHAHAIQVPDSWEFDYQISFAADRDMSDSAYFKKRFAHISLECTVVPFEIRQEFYIRNQQTRITDKVICIGTFHLNEPAPDICYPAIVNGKHTLHEIRACAYLEKETLRDVLDFKMSFWGGGKKSAMIKMSTSICLWQELLSNYKFVLCGSESSGDMAIGIIEAMASDVSFFPENQTSGNLFEDHDIEVITYKDWDDLKLILSDMSALNKKYADEYS